MNYHYTGSMSLSEGKSKDILIQGGFFKTVFKYLQYFNNIFEETKIIKS